MARIELAIELIKQLIKSSSFLLEKVEQQGHQIDRLESLIDELDNRL